MTTQTLLITGCTKGIGRALAIYFAEHDYKIYAVGRDQHQLSELSAVSKNIHPICADITNMNGQNAIESALKKEAYFSIIHNAGILSSSPFHLMAEQDLRQAFETNFFAPLLLTKKLLTKLKGQRVLYISTGAAVQNLQSELAYCTSKGAMHHAIQCLNTEFNSHGVYFSNLRPGMVDTNMQASLREASVDILPSRNFFIRAKEEGKLIAPETVAAFVSFVMFKTDVKAFTENFWNIYDEIYQSEWLPKGGVKPIF